MIAKKSHEEVIAEYWATEPTPEQRAIVEGVQKRLRKWISPKRSLSRELIEERRAESERE